MQLQKKRKKKRIWKQCTIPSDNALMVKPIFLSSQSNVVILLFYFFLVRQSTTDTPEASCQPHFSEINVVLAKEKLQR